MLGILTAVVGTVPAGAQVIESVGTRALGMGGAFVAVADDASAVYWNPAGLASGAFASVVADWTGLATGDLGEPALEQGRGRRGGPLVALGTPPFGLGYYRLRVEAAAPAAPPEVRDGPRRRHVTSLVADHFAATFVHSLADGVHVGAAVKAVRGRAFSGTVPAGASVRESVERAGALAGTQTRVDVDAGLMVDRGTWRAGLVGRNLAAPHFESPGTDGRRLELSRQVRAGVAVLPSARVVLAADADLTTTEEADGRRRSVAAGIEYWTSAARRFALRGGLRAQTVGPMRTAAAMGATWAARRLTYLDVSATLGGRQADRGLSLSARFLY